MRGLKASAVLNFVAKKIIVGSVIHYESSVIIYYDKTAILLRLVRAEEAILIFACKRNQIIHLSK